MEFEEDDRKNNPNNNNNTNLNPQLNTLQQNVF